MGMAGVTKNSTAGHSGLCRVAGDDSFLRAVREAPGDDKPRLIFADYLDDTGRPNWAALIRHQCLGVPLDSSRIRAARQAMGPELTEAFAFENLLGTSYALTTYFRKSGALVVKAGHNQELSESRDRFLVNAGVVIVRGMVDEVVIDQGSFFKTGAAGVGRMPVRAVYFRDKRPHYRRGPGTSPSGWAWYADGRGPGESNIAPALFYKMPDVVKMWRPYGPYGAVYDSEAEAVGDLSASAIVYAKSLAH